MILEEIYYLTKHARFDPKYVERLPVWKRRFHLGLLKKELEAKERAIDNASRKSSSNMPRKR